MRARHLPAPPPHKSKTQPLRFAYRYISRTYNAPSGNTQRHPLAMTLPIARSTSVIPPTSKTQPLRFAYRDISMTCSAANGNTQRLRLAMTLAIARSASDTPPTSKTQRLRFSYRYKSTTYQAGKPPRRHLATARQPERGEGACIRAPRPRAGHPFTEPA